MPSSSPPTSQGRLLPLICLLVVGSLLGLTTTLVKLGSTVGWPALDFLFWSVLGAGLILLVAACLLGSQPRLGRTDVRYYVMSALLSVTLPNVLSFSAIPHVGAGFVALCTAFPLLMTYLMALALRMERLRAQRAWGVAFGLFGAVVLATAKAGEANVEGWWIVAAMASPVFLAFGNIYRTRHWPKGASAFSLAPSMLLASAVLLAPWVLSSGVVLPQGDTPPVVLGLLGAQIAVFVGVYSLYFLLQKLAGPVYLSQIGPVGAIAGAVLAVVVLGEATGWLTLLAGAAILTGVVLVNRSR
jgi:drug/metabolite transporter (DMT)-like permease